MLEAEGLNFLDLIVIALLLAAMVRGITIGLIRESFSIVALAAGVLAGRHAMQPGAAWLREASHGQISATLAPWVAGIVAAVATIAVVGLVGGAIRRGARLVGLGLADRIGGAAIGAAEGLLVAMLLVLGTTYLIGRSHPQVRESLSVAAFDTMRAYVETRSETLPDVAAPAEE